MQVVDLTKRAGSAWLGDYAPSMGAALSYYTVFSLGPLLVIVIAIAGLIFGQDAARGALFEQLRGLMGADAAQAIEALLASVSKPTQGIVATIVGVVVLLIGATTVFGELQDALDRIWRAPARPAGGIFSLLRARILSFGMILGIAFLLMVSLVLSAVISALGKWWAPVFGGWEVLAQLVNLVVGFVLTTAVFAMIYKLMPRVNVRWHDVWIGAAVTSLMFGIGRVLIGLYIGKSGVASGFGAAGSVAILFVWVYYSAQIFLLGAEFTWVYARNFGSMRHMAPVADKSSAAAPARSQGPDAIAAGASPSVAANPVAATQAGGGQQAAAPSAGGQPATGSATEAPARLHSDAAPRLASPVSRTPPVVAVDEKFPWGRVGTSVAVGLVGRLLLPALVKRMLTRRT